MIELNTNKILVKMIKKGSPHSIVFYEDQEDEFLIHVATTRTRTGDIVDESLIIRTDLVQWINTKINNGFNEVSECQERK